MPPQVSAMTHDDELVIIKILPLKIPGYQYPTIIPVESNEYRHPVNTSDLVPKSAIGCTQSKANYHKKSRNPTNRKVQICHDG